MDPWTGQAAAAKGQKGGDTSAPWRGSNYVGSRGGRRPALTAWLTWTPPTWASHCHCHRTLEKARGTCNQPCTFKKVVAVAGCSLGVFAHEATAAMQDPDAAPFLPPSNAIDHTHLVHASRASIPAPMSCNMDRQASSTVQRVYRIRVGDYSRVLCTGLYYGISSCTWSQQDKHPLLPSESLNEWIPRKSRPSIAKPVVHSGTY